MLKFEYTRSSRKEGWITLFFSLNWVSWLIFSALASIISVPFLIYSVKNITTNSRYRCLLTESHFSQVDPISAIENNFDVALKDIIKIEIEDTNGSGASDRWYIHTSSKRFLISPNYDNPYRSFGTKLQEMLPGIPTVET